MSINVRSAGGSAVMAIHSTVSSEGVTFQRGDSYITVPRADLKAALEKELGWTIITEPLPEVREVAGGVGPGVFLEADGPGPRRARADSSVTSPEGLRANALQNLALARYLEQHPPVDPKVEVLANLLKVRGGVGVRDALAIASDLVNLDGVTVPE